MLKGIPVQLKALQVSIDRPGFELNPTSCNPMSVNGTLSGSKARHAPCPRRSRSAAAQSLPFAPP